MIGTAGSDLPSVLRAIAAYLSESLGTERGLDAHADRVRDAASALRRASSVKQAVEAYRLARAVLVSRKKRGGERAVPDPARALMLRASHALEVADWKRAERVRTVGRPLTRREEREILTSTTADDAQPVMERKKAMPVPGFDPRDAHMEALLLMSAVEPAASADLHVLPVVDSADVGGFSRFHPYSCLWCVGLRAGEPCRWDCPVSELCGSAGRLEDLRREGFLERYRDERDRRRWRAGVYGRGDPRANSEEFRRLADALACFSAGDSRAPKEPGRAHLRKALREATQDDPMAIERFLDSLVRLLLVFRIAGDASSPRDTMRRPAQHELEMTERDLGLGTAYPLPSEQRGERILEKILELGHAGDRDREEDDAILAEAILAVRRSVWGRRTLRHLLRERQSSQRSSVAKFHEDADAAWPFP